MARKPSPWYWPERNAWFTILTGQRHPLGDHPSDLPLPLKRKGKWVIPPSIEKQFHSLLAAPEVRTIALTTSGLSVSELFDKFLDWTQKNKAARTFEWYRDHLQSFLNHLGTGRIAASDLRPFHVIEWIGKHPGWSPAYHRGAIVAVQRPFNWAQERSQSPRRSRTHGA